MKKGFYKLKVKPNTPRASEEPVRAIYYPSFESEVVIEDFNGVLKCWKVKKFLDSYIPTMGKFKPKLERVKDGLGSGTGGF